MTYYSQSPFLFFLRQVFFQSSTFYLFVYTLSQLLLNLPLFLLPYVPSQYPFMRNSLNVAVPDQWPNFYIIGYSMFDSRYHSYSFICEFFLFLVSSRVPSSVILSPRNFQSWQYSIPCLDSNIMFCCLTPVHLLWVFFM